MLSLWMAGVGGSGDCPGMSLVQGGGGGGGVKGSQGKIESWWFQGCEKKRCRRVVVGKKGKTKEDGVKRGRRPRQDWGEV